MKIKLLLTFILVILLLCTQLVIATPQNPLNNITDSAQQKLNNASTTVNQTAQEIQQTLNPIQSILNSINSIIQQIQQIINAFS